MFRKLIFITLVFAASLTACSPPDQPPESRSETPSSVNPTTLATTTPFFIPTYQPYQASPTPTRTDLPGAPWVVSRSPNYSYLTDPQPEIRLTFSRYMDEDSVQSSIIIIPAIPYSTRWEGRALFINFFQPLTPGIKYHLILASTATDHDGTRLDKNYDWSYTVENVLGQVSLPTTTDHIQPISLYFNYSMDTSQVQSAIKIFPSISGDFSWDGSSRILTFVPTDRLPADTDISIEFTKPIKDVDGNEYPTPDPISITTPSGIFFHTPRQGSLVNPTTSIGVTFDRPMDQGATEAAFEINPQIPGDFDWNENSMTFTPGNLSMSEWTIYTVTISSSATSLSGEYVLQEPYQWSFKTDKYDDIASFGIYGANAQVLDVNGRRAVQFVLLSSENTILEFELFETSFDQFLERYISGFHGTRGLEAQPVIDSSELQLKKTWQQEFNINDTGFGIVQEVIIQPDIPSGLYILNLVSGRVDDQLFLVISPNSLVIKQTKDQIIAWVSEIGGLAIEGIEVSVYTQNADLIAQGETDDQGIFRTQVSGDKRPMIVIAQNGNDISVSGLSDEWQTSRDGWRQPVLEVQKLCAYIYSDRPIYRPGHTVHFKAILRHDDDGVLTLPIIGTPVTVRIHDSQDNVVITSKLASSAYGTISGDFQLAKDSLLGDYAIEVSLDDETQMHTFIVEDFRKPDTLVEVDANADLFLMGDLITKSIVISADIDTYQTGDAANLIIESKFSGPALLTFERGTTRHEELIYITAPLTTQDIVIWEDFAPNIFVTINAWEMLDTSLTFDTITNLPDSRLHSDTIELSVPITGKTLSVTITPNKEIYSPGEDATISIQVTDSEGNPTQAEVSLAIVDEALSSLSESLSGSLFDHFYGKRPHLVRTYDSMALVREFQLNEHIGVDEETFTRPQTWIDFHDTAAWYPVISTDSNGEASITIPLPDTLTQWRITVKAVSAENTLVGEAYKHISTE